MRFLRSTLWSLIKLTLQLAVLLILTTVLLLIVPSVRAAADDYVDIDRYVVAVCQTIACEYLPSLGPSASELELMTLLPTHPQKYRQVDSRETTLDVPAVDRVVSATP